eukprot:gene7566-719_t
MGRGGARSSVNAVSLSKITEPEPAQDTSSPMSSPSATDKKTLVNILSLDMVMVEGKMREELMGSERRSRAPSRPPSRANLSGQGSSTIKHFPSIPKRQGCLSNNLAGSMSRGLSRKFLNHLSLAPSDSKDQQLSWADNGLQEPQNYSDAEDELCGNVEEGTLRHTSRLFELMAEQAEHRAQTASDRAQTTGQLPAIRLKGAGETQKTDLATRKADLAAAFRNPSLLTVEKALESRLSCDNRPSSVGLPTRGSIRSILDAQTQRMARVDQKRKKQLAKMVPEYSYSQPGTDDLVVEARRRMNEISKSMQTIIVKKQTLMRSSLPIIGPDSRGSHRGSKPSSRSGVRKVSNNGTIRGPGRVSNSRLSSSGGDPGPGRVSNNRLSSSSGGDPLFSGSKLPGVWSQQPSSQSNSGSRPSSRLMQKTGPVTPNGGEAPLNLEPPLVEEPPTGAQEGQGALNPPRTQDRRRSSGAQDPPRTQDPRRSSGAQDPSLPPRSSGSQDPPRTQDLRGSSGAQDIPLPTSTSGSQDPPRTQNLASTSSSQEQGAEAGGAAGAPATAESKAAEAVGAEATGADGEGGEVKEGEMEVEVRKPMLPPSYDYSGAFGRMDSMNTRLRTTKKGLVSMNPTAYIEDVAAQMEADLREHAHKAHMISMAGAKAAPPKGSKDATQEGDGWSLERSVFKPRREESEAKDFYDTETVLCVGLF